MPAVTQTWTHELPFMQQSVLLAAIRGPDGQPKYNAVKMLLRWYRRCVLISALDGVVLNDPFDSRGGSFTGPSISRPTEYTNLAKAMLPHIDTYVSHLDGLPGHFNNHFRDAVQILGYKHPDEKIAEFWRYVYHRLVNELNLVEESVHSMDRRLGDNRDNWLKTSDPATQS